MTKDMGSRALAQEDGGQMGMCSSDMGSYCQNWVYQV